jgi:hypothetical protein
VRQGKGAMSAKDDINELLKDWPYDPNDYVREVMGQDGRPKLQVRFPMGVEQYELDGRPDGVKPFGHASYLDYYIHLFDEARKAGHAETFRIAAQDCDFLRDEAMIHYYRYDLLYQRKDYERVIRDTGRNLQSFDFIAEHAESPEDGESMEIYRPFALRLHYASRALLSLRRRRYDDALRHAHLGVARLKDLEPVDDPKWRREWRSAIVMLRRLDRHITRVKPLSRRQRLQMELNQAVAREDYEVAAKLRDRLASMPMDDEDKGKGSPSPR